MYQVEQVAFEGLIGKKVVTVEATQYPDCAITVAALTNDGYVYTWVQSLALSIKQTRAYKKL